LLALILLRRVRGDWAVVGSAVSCSGTLCRWSMDGSGSVGALLLRGLGDWEAPRPPDHSHVDRIAESISLLWFRLDPAAAGLQPVSSYLSSVVEIVITASGMGGVEAQTCQALEATATSMGS
jgi:hypothetical protein